MYLKYLYHCQKDKWKVMIYECCNPTHETIAEKIQVIYKNETNFKNKNSNVGLEGSVPKMPKKKKQQQGNKTKIM